MKINMGMPVLLCHGEYTEAELTAVGGKTAVEEEMRKVGVEIHVEWTWDWKRQAYTAVAYLQACEVSGMNKQDWLNLR